MESNVTPPSLDKLVAEFIQAYPNFEIAERDDASTTLKGEFVLDAEYNGIRLAEIYSLKIVAFEGFPVVIPEVYETNNQIPRSYEHLYDNHKLCLGINGEIALRLWPYGTLADFVRGAITDYLYTAKFFLKFGRYPFGERSHCEDGIFEFYREYFNVESHEAICNLLFTIAKQQYRGHLPCPCGSGIRGRRCHGAEILKVINTPIRLVFELDLKSIVAIMTEKYNLKAEQQKLLIQTTCEKQKH